MGVPSPVQYGPSQKPPDPLQLLTNLLNQPPPDFNQLAQEQLGPAYQAQLSAINNAKGTAKNTAGYNDKQLQAMYAALAKDAGANANVIKQNYADSFNSVNNTYNSGKADSNAVFNSGQAKVNALLSKLGIQAAAPDALGQSYTNQGLINGILNANQQGAVNALNLGKQGDLSFNTAQQNIAGLEGNNRRADLQQLLGKTLAGYDQQALQASGNYNSQLAQRQYDLQQSYLGQLQQQQNTAYGAYHDMMDEQYKLSQSQTPSLSQQWNMMSPVDKGYYQASNLFGPQDAGKAMQLVMANGNSNAQNSFDFVQKVLAANSELMKTDPANAIPPNQIQQLQSLASFMYDQVNPRYNPYNNVG